MADHSAKHATAATGAPAATGANAAPAATGTTAATTSPAASSATAAPIATAAPVATAAATAPATTAATVATTAKKRNRFAATADGVGVQFIDWARAHGVAACILLAAICALALGSLFWFVVFSDFSASADFIYNQF